MQSGLESDVKTTGIGQGVLNKVPITVAAKTIPAAPTQFSPSKSVGTIALNYTMPAPTGQVLTPSNSATSRLEAENKPTQSYNATPSNSSSGSFTYLKVWRVGTLSILVTLLLAS